MRVLHIISSGGMYGAEAVILNMSQTLNRGPHRSILGVFSNSAQPNLQLHEAAANLGIESHTIPCKGQLDLSVASALRQLAKETRADLIHAHGYKADVYVAYASRKLQLTLISTCHTWYDNDLFVRLYGALDRRVLRGFDGVVAVSTEVQQRLLDAGVAPGRVRLIRNGIDLAPFTTDRSSVAGPQRALTVGLVGRLSPEKGIDLFIRAAANLLQHAPDTNFVVVGDGPDRASLQALINQLGVGERVSLLGRRDDMPAVYASLDLLVSASRQEGLPVALLEGMASGLPLVATDVGAVPTIVRNGSTGTLVPPGDYPALQIAILNLLHEPERRSRYGAAARRLIADEFSADRMTEEYLALYEEALFTSTKRYSGGNDQSRGNH